MPSTRQLPLALGMTERRGVGKVEPRSFRVAGMFAGIGGFERGFADAGHQTVLFCENDPFASAVLEARFPDVSRATDIRELRRLPRDVDVLVGGFPCQDLSQAGRTQGIEGSRSGLVGEVFRLLHRQRVPWVVLENVPFMLQLAGGRALEVIIRELERLEYRWAYRVIDSRAFGLPQRRERVFLVASQDEDPRHVLLSEDAEEQDVLAPEDAAFGFYWTEGVRGLGWAVDAVPTLKGGSGLGIPSPPAIWLPSGQIVKPDIRDAERMQGFKAGWTSPAARVGRDSFRWKLVGNAVSVPVAKWLGQRLSRPRDFELHDVRPFEPGGKAWPRVAWNVGDGPMTAPVSQYPVRRKYVRLEQFLRYPTEPLSEKATAGFLSRARRGRLRFPNGFLAAIEAHLQRARYRDGLSAENR